MCQDCGCSDTSQTNQVREISLKRDILTKNNQIAQHNRKHLTDKGIYCLNWISAPGSGKTLLLEKLITEYHQNLKFFVIEGDQQTDNDSQRIIKAGAQAFQINTGSACHLDAEMIHQAMHHLDLEAVKVLIIENIGNMVCPTAFDLGEKAKIAIISTPEGEDKPVKYPDLLLTAKVLIINKIDLIPYLDFDLDKCLSLARQVNPNLKIFPLSAKTGEGVADFYNWLQNQIST